MRRFLYFINVAIFLILFTGCSTKSSMQVKNVDIFEERLKINIAKITNDTSKIYEYNIEDLMEMHYYLI